MLQVDHEAPAIKRGGGLRGMSEFTCCQVHGDMEQEQLQQLESPSYTVSAWLPGLASGLPLLQQQQQETWGVRFSGFQALAVRPAHQATEVPSLLVALKGSEYSRSSVRLAGLAGKAHC